MGGFGKQSRFMIEPVLTPIVTRGVFVPGRGMKAGHIADLVWALQLRQVTVGGSMQSGAFSRRRNAAIFLCSGIGSVMPTLEAAACKQP
jgi:hypothetical protein